jgi:hypothetical protein
LYAWLSICRSPLPFSAGVSFTAGNPPTGRPALPASCQPLSYSQPDPVPKPAAPAGAFQQLAALLNRNFLSYWRNPSVNLARFGVTLLMAVIVGSIEWGKGK